MLGREKGDKRPFVASCYSGAIWDTCLSMPASSGKKKSDIYIADILFTTNSRYLPYLEMSLRHHISSVASPDMVPRSVTHFTNTFDNG